MSDMTEAELRRALDAQIEYTGQLQTQIDALMLKNADLHSEIAVREESAAEVEAIVRAIRKLVK